MMNLVSLPGIEAPQPSGADEAVQEASTRELTALGQRFEQMLWAEMLSHTGLEEAFTKSGGEAASAFSRYVVEAIAKDLAEKQPLGLAQAVDLTSEATTAVDASGNRE